VRAIGALITGTSVDGPVSGTAFAVSQRFALTAFHCVGDRDTGLVTSTNVVVRLSEDKSFTAVVDDCDPRNDIAALRITSALPDGYDIVRIGRTFADLWKRQFSAIGYPAGRAFAHDAVTIGGRIENLEASILGGVPAIQLFADQAAAGRSLPGYSGAPVIVAMQSWLGPEEVAVGLIRWAQLNADGSGRAIGGDAFAAPLGETVERWADIRPLLTGPLAEAPAAGAINNFLHHYLGDPDSPVPFGGRDSTLNALVAWLDQDPEHPYSLVTSQAGRGKSALVSRLWGRLMDSVAKGDRRLEIVFVPITIRYDLNTEVAVLRAVVSRMAAAHGEVLRSESRDNLRDAFHAYLARDAPEARGLVLLLDGLDEAANWDAGPALFPARAGARVKILVSTRFTASRPTPRHWLEHLGWDEQMVLLHSLPLLSYADTRDVVVRMGPRLDAVAIPPALTRLHELCQGDPLIVGLFVRYLWDYPPGDSTAAMGVLRDQQPGLEGFMEHWWSDQERLWGAGLADIGARVALVFNMLACALGPIRDAELIRASQDLGGLDGDQLDAARKPLDRFVIRETPDSYVIAHPRLADYRLAKLRTSGDYDRYDDAFVTWGSDALATLRNGLVPPDRTPFYIVRHYGEHLERANAAPERFLQLITPEWRQAWEATTDEANGHLVDVQRALTRVSGIDHAAAALDRSGPHVDAEVRCILVRGEAASSLALISGELAGALVKHRVWSGRRAVSTIGQLEGIARRTAAFAALTPFLDFESVNAVQQQLPALQEADPEAHGSALAAVVARLAALGQWTEAHVIVDAQPIGIGHGMTAIALLPYAEPNGRADLMSSLIRDLRELSPLQRIEMMSRLSSVADAESVTMPLGQSPSELLETYLKEVGVWPRNAGSLQDLHLIDWARVFPYVARWLPKERRTDAVMKAIGELRDWASVLARLQANDNTSTEPREYPIPMELLSPDSSFFRVLEPYLTESRTELSSLALRSLVTRFVELFGVLAPYIDESLTHALLVELDRSLITGTERTFALIHVLATMGRSDRAGAEPEIFATLNQVLQDPGIHDFRAGFAMLAKVGLARRTLDAVGELGDDSWAKADFLVALAPNLDIAGVRMGLELARRARREARIPAVAALLARLATFGLSEAEEALGLATRSDDPDETATASAVLEDDSRGYDWLDHLGIDDVSLRYATLRAISPRIRWWARTVDAAVTSVFTDAAGSNTLAWDLFLALLPHVPNEDILSDEMMGLFYRLVQSGVYERRDLMLPYLRRVAAVRGPDATIIIGQDLSDDFELPLALSLVAATDFLDRADIAGALRVAKGISHPIEHAIARAGLLRRLPWSRRPAAWAAVAAPLSSVDTELRAPDVALLLSLIPTSFRGEVLAQLVPMTLLAGLVNFISDQGWVDCMRVVVRFVNADQLDTVQQNIPPSAKGSSKEALIGAIAVRRAELGLVDEAFELLHNVSTVSAAAGLEGMLSVIGDDALTTWVIEADQRIDATFWRGSRAHLWATATARFARVPRHLQRRLFDMWLLRQRTRGEVLIDLIGFETLVRALGGSEATVRLAAYIRSPS
jgi:hypothetical protein